MAGERDAEGAPGTIADTFRDLGNIAFLSAQQVFGHGHAPGEQIFHRSETHGTAETFEEGRTGQGNRLGHFGNRPTSGRVFVYASYHLRQPFVGEPPHEARRRRSSGAGTKGFDQQNLQQAGKDNLTRGPQGTRFFRNQLHYGRQPGFSANVHKLWEQ